MHDAPSIFLDDLVIGDTFVSEMYQMNQDQMIEFASRYDPQPFHVDPQAAEIPPFRGLAASGWHTTAITMRLLIKSLPISGGIIGTGVGADLKLTKA